MITNPQRLLVDDEGTPQGLVSEMDFVGAGVSAAVTGNKATVTVSGGGSGVAVQSNGVALGTATTINMDGGLVTTFSSGTAKISVGYGRIIVTAIGGLMPT